MATNKNIASTESTASKLFDKYHQLKQKLGVKSGQNDYITKLVSISNKMKIENQQLKSACSKSVDRSKKQITQGYQGFTTNEIDSNFDNSKYIQNTNFSENWPIRNRTITTNKENTNSTSKLHSQTTQQFAIQLQEMRLKVQQAEQLLEEYTQSKENNSNIKYQMQELSSENWRLKIEINELKSEHEKIVFALQEQISNLEYQIKNYDEKLSKDTMKNQFRAQLENLKQQNSKLLQENQYYQQQILELQEIQSKNKNCLNEMSQNQTKQQLILDNSKLIQIVKNLQHENTQLQFENQNLQYQINLKNELQATTTVKGKQQVQNDKMVNDFSEIKLKSQMKKSKFTNQSLSATNKQVKKKSKQIQDLFQQLENEESKINEQKKKIQSFKKRLN